MTTYLLPGRETVLKAVSAALRNVATRDKVLFTLQAHELTLVHRFGVYLETHLQRELRQYGLTIDFDYDRSGRSRKLLPPRSGRDDERRFRPDLIVHRRLVDKQNLLVVEWKKNAKGPVLKGLEERIRSLVVSNHEHPSYGYQVGVLVNSSDNAVRWRAFDSAGPLENWQRISCS